MSTMSHKELFSSSTPSSGSHNSWFTKLRSRFSGNHKGGEKSRSTPQNEETPVSPFTLPAPQTSRRPQFFDISTNNDQRNRDHTTPRDREPSKPSTNNTLPHSNHHGPKQIRATQQTAYDEAYKRLTPEERGRIDSRHFKDASQLLHNLRDANDKSVRDSRTRRGLKKLAPKLEVIQQVADFTGAIGGSAEPTGALSALTQLASACCSVGIQLAGAADNLDAQIHRLFDLAPRLLQCDGIKLSTNDPDLLRKDLVKVDTGMFKFYLVAMKIFDYNGRFITAIMKYKDEMTEAVNEFSSFWSHFLEGVQIDTLETAAETLDVSRKSHLADILEKECAHELEFRPPTPAAGTCQWLFSTDGPFKLWNQPPTPSTHFLTMFGAMGSGKTVATAYLADHLASESGDRTVLRYYIHSDSERNKPTNIYCSLIRQFLSWHPELEVYLWQLLKECNATDPQRQARRPEVLRQCVIGLLEAGPKRVCIFLDALDALDFEAREELGRFFQSLRKLMCQCKVFLTSQPDSCVKKLVLGEMFDIERLRKDVRDENYRIAEHLMDVKFFRDGRRHQYGKEEQQRLIKSVAALADGSPMMVYLNVAHADALTRGALRRTVDEVLSVIANAPSGYSKIPQKWAEIRKQLLEHLDVGREMVDPLLRFLAVTSRPVTIREACAFVVYDTQNCKKLPRELDTHGQKSIIEWIRPFVVTDDASDPESVLRLYHNSLQRLIVLKEPNTWDTADGIQDDKSLSQRKATMNGELASKCIRYLHYPECSAKGFIQSGVPKGSFFNYAACAWPHHMASSAGPTAQQVEDIVGICKPGSGILMNWTDEHCRHAKTFLPEPSELDSLVISVHFRLEALTAAILDRPDVFESPKFFHPKSAEIALTCTLQTERFALANTLFAESGARLRTLDVWKQVMRTYSPALDFWFPKPITADHDRDLKGLSKHKAEAKRLERERARKATLAALAQRERAWQAFLDPFVQHLLPDLAAKWASDALWEAVFSGCLAVVKKLFACAGRDGELRRKLLDPRGSPGQHQVVGVAAHQGDVDMLRFLLRQPGIERHVRHVGPGGETVFHAAAQMISSAFRPEVFVELKRAWPEGVDVLDERSRHFRDLLRPGENELVG